LPVALLRAWSDQWDGDCGQSPLPVAAGSFGFLQNLNRAMERSSNTGKGVMGMKKFILLTALSLTISGGSAFAYDYSRHDNYRVAYVDPRRSSLERHVDHLNRMLTHVRWQVRHYRADWRVRRDVQAISREIDRVNYRYRHGNYNGGNLRREVDRLHDRLHAIEQRLHVLSRDFYRWN